MRNIAMYGQVPQMSFRFCFFKALIIFFKDSLPFDTYSRNFKQTQFKYVVSNGNSSLKAQSGWEFNFGSNKQN